MAKTIKQFRAWCRRVAREQARQNKRWHYTGNKPNQGDE